MYEQMIEKSGELFEVSLLKYKNEMIEKCNTLVDLGIEYVPIKSVFNIIYDEKEKIKKTKIGFRVKV